MWQVFRKLRLKTFFFFEGYRTGKADKKQVIITERISIAAGIVQNIYRSMR